MNLTEAIHHLDNATTDSFDADNRGDQKSLIAWAIVHRALRARTPVPQTTTPSGSTKKHHKG
jgi:hypothetical protein